MNNTLTVEKLFEGRLFRIPDYQRGYAWGRKQWDDFWEDVDLLESGHHYTGTVVLDLVDKPAAGASPEPSIWDQHGKSYQLFDVVDGQQRLTTIVLVLDAIRLGARGVGASDAPQSVPPHGPENHDRKRP